MTYSYFYFLSFFFLLLQFHLFVYLFVSLPVFCFNISQNRFFSTISVHYFILACIIALVIVLLANSHSSFTKEVFIYTTNIYRRRQSVIQLNVNVQTPRICFLYHFLIFVEFVFDFSQIFFFFSFVVYYFGSQIYLKRLHHC